MAKKLRVIGDRFLDENDDIFIRLDSYEGSASRVEVRELVHRWNAHEALVGALENAVRCVEVACYSFGDIDAKEDVAKMRAALEAAKEKP